MRFLLEADDDYKQVRRTFYNEKSLDNAIERDKKTPELLKIKKSLEIDNKEEYKNMKDAQRNDFILDIIDRASNKDTLSKSRLAVVNAIKDSNWDKNVLQYLSDLPKGIDISNPIVEVTTNLIKDNKLNYNKGKEWLLNTSLYDRNENDVLYTIKALTLLDNPKLQKSVNGEKILKGNLAVKNFIHKGVIDNADRINDIINARINPKAEIKKKVKTDNIKGVNKSRTEEDPKNLIRGYLQEISQYNRKAEDVINNTYNPNVSFDDNLVNIFKELNLDLELKR